MGSRPSCDACALRKLLNISELNFLLSKMEIILSQKAVVRDKGSGQLLEIIYCRMNEQLYL